MTHAENKDRMTEKLNDSKPGVPSVLSVLAIEPHRPLSQRERVILAEVEAENDPLILEALRMFSATVAGIAPTDNFSSAGRMNRRRDIALKMSFHRWQRVTGRTRVPALRGLMPSFVYELLLQDCCNNCAFGPARFCGCVAVANESPAQSM